MPALNWAFDSLVNSLYLLTGASIRCRLRWARQHVYSWLVLAPIVLALSYATVSRLASTVDLRTLHPGALLGLACLLNLCLICASLSRATSELYHLRRPESLFEALPIDASTHLHAALLVRTGRTAVAALALLSVLSRFGGGIPGGLTILAPLFSAVILMASVEILAALNWIHWGHRRTMTVAALASLATLTTAALAGRLSLDIAGLGEPGDRLLWLITSLAWAAALYIIARISHRRWRASDLEYAARLDLTGSGGVFLAQLLTRRIRGIVGAQLTRDLLLTLRGFSSAVYVAWAFASLWTVSLVSLLATDALPYSAEGVGWLDVTWLPSVMAIKVACVLGIVSMSALLPVLLGHELPHFWLERASGTTGLDMWRTKLWYARIVSSPIPLVVWVAGALSDKVPAFYAFPLLAECLWLWWLASSMIGALSFEIPGRVALSVILAVTVGLTAGVLSAMVWPVGLLIYAQAMHSLTQRGRARARYFLMVGED